MKRYTQKTIRFYDDIVDTYIKGDAAVVLKDKIDRFIELLPGRKVLDVACGPGHDTNYLVGRGLDCLGIDLAKRMIEIAKQNYQGKFKIMDFFSLDFKEDLFDGLWCSSVFVHVAKKDLFQLLGNFKRILKNEGILGLITVKKQKTKRDKSDIRKYVMYGKEEFENYLLRSDYKILLSEVFVYGGKERLFIIAQNKKEMHDVFRLSHRKARVAISPFCNLNCLYCDGPKSRKQGRSGAMEDFRRKSLNQKVISANTFVEIIKALHLAGFNKITLTGGEPLLNPEWDSIVKKAKKNGISEVWLTTNGTLLNSYLEKKRLPKEITLLTISLDTFNAEEFKSITRGARLKPIIEALEKIRTTNPKLTIRTNKVVIRRDLKFLLDYIEVCEESGVIDEINLLNLILKEPWNKKEKEFFEKEFVSTLEIVNFLSEKAGYKFFLDQKYEFETKTAKGNRIIIKDTNLTLRTSQCDKCPIYCQEGFYTIRVATDGTIRTCIDYENKLPFIDCPLELKKGSLAKKLKEIMKMFENVKLKTTLKEFFKKYNIQLKGNIRVP